MQIESTVGYQPLVVCSKWYFIKSKTGMVTLCSSHREISGRNTTKKVDTYFKCGLLE